MFNTSLTLAKPSTATAGSTWGELTPYEQQQATVLGDGAEARAPGAALRARFPSAPAATCFCPSVPARCLASGWSGESARKEAPRVHVRAPGSI